MAGKIWMGLEGLEYMTEILSLLHALHALVVKRIHTQQCYRRWLAVQYNRRKAQRWGLRDGTKQQGAWQGARQGVRQDVRPGVRQGVLQAVRQGGITERGREKRYYLCQTLNLNYSTYSTVNGTVYDMIYSMRRLTPGRGHQDCQVGWACGRRYGDTEAPHATILILLIYYW